ncbi:hypothetical protein MWN41_11235 [Ornithobacterium rhinotracheale]|uniref:hypothetical protein n=1 Tax=Ornithobacterium rhinotracheale TaxID=28251 RepID=UPI001FF19CD8|nr:hypothetical protein [Ornithobacterium rhinotracheale]MCK0203587.1 hypothetical protein [Ornithobacterium rhinotracheale]
MTKQETAVIINGKRVELNDYLTTIKENNLARSGVGSVFELGYLINNLVGVCASALYNLQNCENMTHLEQYKAYGADVTSVADVLLFARGLMPLQELELISDIENALKS